MPQNSPRILILYPSCFYYPAWMERVEVKTPLLLMASYLQQFYPVEYADFEITIGRPNTPIQIRRFERKVREFLAQADFDILAVSCWTSLSYKATIKVAQICRELCPDKLIVVGGYHPSARPHEFQSEDQLFDYIICGEGELALRECARQFVASGRPSATTFVNAPILPQEAFVPHDWDLISSFVKLNFPQGLDNVYLFLSRGCPFDCAFCMEPLKERKWRAYSPELAVQEIDSAAGRFQPHSISLCDACFGMRPAWRKDFLKRLVDLSPPYWVTLETRPEYLDEEDVKLLSRLKVEIQLGIESCSPDMLRIMRKSKQPEHFLREFKRASELMSDHGVLHRANLIFNHPGETRKTLNETFQFIDEMTARSDSALMWAAHGFMHFPGCDCDRNHAHYESSFGAHQPCGDWWHEERDQYENSLRTVPSSELAGDGIELWRTLLRERDDSMKHSLSDKAVKFASAKYFPHWKDNEPTHSIGR